ncbi:MAG: nucleotidyltransferase domain-containing protein [Planctomycetes bacterium]|nr:nucleotidyltransferase domain-containing protein [Planctomycetota bacterium]
MRKSTSIDALFPAVRQHVLTATLMQPERWWYLSKLAVYLQRSPSSLQREVARLADAGILETRQEANRTYYRPNADCPLLPELTGLIAKTVGVADVVRHALAAVARRIEWAFIYGSLARGEEVSESDVDLLVIGDVKLSELARSIKIAEKKLGRPVNPTVFPRAEFAAKLRAGQHFVHSVVAGDKLFLVGDAREFAKTFAVETTTPPRNKPRRTG